MAPRRFLSTLSGNFLKKGSPVYIEGRLQTRKWQDKEGKERSTTEIVANEMKMLGSRGGAGGSKRAGAASSVISSSAGAACP